MVRPSSQLGTALVSVVFLFFCKISFVGAARIMKLRNDGSCEQPENGDALVLRARIVRDDWCTSQSKSAKDACKNGNLKQHRPKNGLHITASDLKNAMVPNLGGNEIQFVGQLSSWEGFTNLTLESISCCDDRGACQDRLKDKNFKTLWPGFLGINHTSVLHDTVFMKKQCASPLLVQAKFRRPPWVACGWSADSPGFVFWFQAQRPRDKGGPLLLHGQDIVRDPRGDTIRVKRAHMFAHRYFKASPTWRDTKVYHAGVLLEWSGLEGTPHMTLVEVAWRNGLSGYMGKCNWYDDARGEQPTAIYKEMVKTPAMVQPWDDHKLEVRILDIDATNRDEFTEYMHKYTNTFAEQSDDLRFNDPSIPHSADLGAHGRSRNEVFQGILNYAAAKNGRYVELVEFGALTRNCQTFAADFYSWLTGTETKPFHTLARLHKVDTAVFNGKS